MCHEDRQIGAEQDMARKAAEEHLADAAVSVATHYQQVGACRAGRSQDSLDGRTRILL
jgi:hypothetical protein